MGNITDGKNGTNGTNGKDGADGASFWTSTTAPTTPNYTFQVANLNGPSKGSVKVGDIILYSYYRYTVTSVSGDTVLTGSRVSLRGATGAAGATPDVYVIRWKNVWSTYPASDWEIKVYKNGQLCTEKLYAYLLYSASSDKDCTTEAGVTGNITGTKTWSTKSAIRYIVEIYEDSTKENLLASAFLTPAK